ncbi:hypothetical protein [Roseivivax sp.]
MSRLIGLVVLVAIVIAVLLYFGFIELSPEGEAALEETQENVGTAIENTGEALQNSGN